MRISLLLTLIIGSLTHQVTSAPTSLPPYEFSREKLFRTARSPVQERELQTVFDEETALEALELDQLRRLAAIIPFIRISDKRSGTTSNS